MEHVGTVSLIFSGVEIYLHQTEDCCKLYKKVGTTLLTLLYWLD